MRRYEPDDFMRIRDFLVATYPRFERPTNWTIERWNFSVSMARIMNGVTLQEWEDDVGIWEEDGEHRIDLDLHVRDAGGAIAAFATMWYDAQNRIGILEPVGTVPAYRKMGLGRACVAQLANQVRAAGGVEVHVGSDQPFYVRLGFEVQDKYGIWRKVVG
jgi:GNAT superfamily N-acetyltransferase